MAFTVVLLSYGDTINIGATSEEAIEECQQDLPRNLQCVLIAVPENEAE